MTYLINILYFLQDNSYLNILNLSIILCRLHFDIQLYKHQKYPEISHKNLVDFEIFRKYLDRFYITSISYTLFISFIYLVGTFFLFVIIRYLL
jgi:hypothetical protein